MYSAAKLIEEEYPSDIYSSIVSSQFDADRLDYLRRDKMMTGTEYAGFDLDWLLNNLEIDKLMIGGDGDEVPVEVEGLILGSKGLQAAESYLLGRFHLYTQVYMHKTTRAAEKMLGALLRQIAGLLTDGEAAKTGLPANHPVQRFFGNEGATLDNYLALDDAVVWGCLPLLEQADDDVVSELARRLRHRILYKCVDIGARAESIGGDVAVRFTKRLREAQEDGRFSDVDVLEDRAPVSAYKFRDYDSPDALLKITIRRPDWSGDHEDLAKISPVVKALDDKRIFRVYARDGRVKDDLENIWREAKG